MKKTLVQVFALAFVLAAVGGVAASAGADGSDAALKEIAKYKSWTRVTDAPVPIEPFFSGG